MSYDLMVFDPAAAPRDRTEFLAWYRQQMKDAGDGSATTPALNAWYGDMCRTFPDMDSVELEASDDAGSYMTDYSSTTPHMIYAAFAWSVAEEAYALTRELAIRHQIGFFDVSATDGEILFPA
ncbi:hypothetical protein B0W47_04485 [Komagataeibacter nataicola]|uniref:Uncharacterized protein n=2 Tax=Komagataeibacter nataicola TaxID=265960 RepID=A0A9N7C5R1_9PROT|nr:hypothetical protein [Komagataeibacter nataicola]AQU86846.1 hypothetical protein B0W47_04485 [Komagataeibacter nataicola]PYD67864.1 hypothetical protein CDI09_00545 [Komagataeibacter nataicola]WEQ56202.1 hypothetical protein LV564_03630 [Komagataeibacter nataicola]WNM07790.1 hypothetical protein RI056_12230 [Komagataeibacter nataicola]